MFVHFNVFFFLVVVVHQHFFYFLVWLVVHFGFVFSRCCCCSCCSTSQNIIIAIGYKYGFYVSWIVHRNRFNMIWVHIHLFVYFNLFIIIIYQEGHVIFVTFHCCYLFGISSIIKCFMRQTTQNRSDDELKLKLALFVLQFFYFETNSNSWEELNPTLKHFDKCSSVKKSINKCLTVYREINANETSEWLNE